MVVLAAFRGEDEAQRLTGLRGAHHFIDLEELPDFVDETAEQEAAERESRTSVGRSRCMPMPL